MIYYIDEADPLVRLDLSDLLAEHDPTGRVVILDRLADLRADMDGSVMITSSDTAHLAAAVEVSAFTEAGGVLLLIGSQSRTEGGDPVRWSRVDRPFTDEAFLTALVAAQLTR